MIEVKAKANNERGGCNVSISMEGKGMELIEEALAVIQGVMGSLKEQDKLLHVLTISAIAENPKVLLGKEEDTASNFERFVATTKFGEGVN